MAKSKNTVSFKNAELIFGDKTIEIQETEKECVKCFDLIAELKKFKNIKGIALTLSNDEEIEPID